MHPVQVDVVGLQSHGDSGHSAGEQTLFNEASEEST
jgi:hypothetical protein